MMNPEGTEATRSVFNLQRPSNVALNSILMNTATVLKSLKVITLYLGMVRVHSILISLMHTCCCRILCDWLPAFGWFVVRESWILV